MPVWTLYNNFYLLVTLSVSYPMKLATKLDVGIIKGTNI